MKEEIYDERLYKKLSDAYKVGFLMMVILDLIMIGLNFLIWKENKYIFLLTIGLLVVGIIFIIIKSSIIKINPISFFKGIDEGILSYRNKALTQLVVIGLFIILIAEMFFLKLNLVNPAISSYLNLIWLIPSLYVTFKTLKIKPLNSNAEVKVNTKKQVIRTFIIFLYYPLL